MNIYPNNQLQAKSEVAIKLIKLHFRYASPITNKEQYKKLEYRHGQKTWHSLGKPQVESMHSLREAYRTMAHFHQALSAKRTGTLRRTKVSP